MASNMFPLLPQSATATLALDIAYDATAKTHDVYEIASVEVKINAAGADSAPTHTVPVTAAVGQVVHVDILSRNKDSDSQAATIVFTYGDSTVTFDADAEEATIMFLENTVIDVRPLFGGAASTATIA